MAPSYGPKEEPKGFMASPTLIADQNLDRELYRTLAENACDLICQAGTTGRYLYASPIMNRSLATGRRN